MPWRRAFTISNDITRKQNNPPFFGPGWDEKNADIPDSAKYLVSFRACIGLRLAPEDAKGAFNVLLLAMSSNLAYFAKRTILSYPQSWVKFLFTGGFGPNGGAWSGNAAGIPLKGIYQCDE
jgi:hypothetical protein